MAEVKMYDIDANTRVINIPSSTIIGVESDEKVERIRFRCDRYPRADVDLLEFNKYVNYRNANGDLNAYLIEDVEVDEDNIILSWILHRDVTKYKGKVNFIVCAKKSTAEGEIDYEWNTRVATATVDEGLEVAETIEEEYADVIEQILVRLNAIESKEIDENTIANAVSNYFAKNPITDTNTTYTVSISGNTLTLHGSDGSTDTVTLPSGSSDEGLSPELKNAFVEAFKELAYSSNAHPATDTLITLLGGTIEPPAKTLTYIVATYDGGEVVLGTDVASLDITVTAHYSDGSTENVTSYGVSGSISNVGNNTITISYNGKSTTVTVVGYEEPVQTTVRTVDVATLIAEHAYAYSHVTAGASINTNSYSISNVKNGDVFKFVTGWNDSSNVNNKLISVTSNNTATTPNCTLTNFEKNGYTYGIQTVTINQDYDVLYVGLDARYLDLCTWTREGGF